MDLVFLTGASGSGKTTVLEQLEASRPESFSFNHFDSVGVPSVEEMNRRHGSGAEWQRQTTHHWVRTMLTQDPTKPSILDGQMRLSFVVEACRAHGVEDPKIVLIDCDDDVRTRRLTGRGQPELADPTMMNWAAHLREEARRIGADILDTSTMSAEASVLALVRMLETWEERRSQEHFA